jgi:hypothetical protein
MQDLVSAYWTIDGKTIPTEISADERMQRYASMWTTYFSQKDEENNTYKSISQAEYLKKGTNTGYQSNSLHARIPQ